MDDKDYITRYEYDERQKRIDDEDRRQNHSGVYVVDLANNPWTNLYTLDKGITTDLSNSHYAPVAYQKMARIIERSISQVIRANQADFHNVPYIPYDTASANVE